MLLSRDHFGKQIMVLVAISSKGPLFLKFFRQGERLNSESYLEILRDEMIPAIKRVHPTGFVLQQDGASSHTAAIVQQYLRRFKTTPDILNMAVAYGMETDENNVPFDFIEKNDWPAKSPDLNVCDYRF